MFVGRGAELDPLVARLRAAGSGPGGVVLVRGPAGIGKSTLVERALTVAAVTPVVRGYCLAEPTPPLWPWREVLRPPDGAGARTPGRRERRPGPTTDARQPELSEDVMLRSDPATLASARFAELARLADLVRARSGVVVLEDLHWADSASLDLLQRVAAGAGDGGPVVVGTVRSAAPEGVAIALAGLARFGASIVDLPAFTPDEVAELVTPDRAVEVHQRTGGLPLLVAAVRAGYGSADLSTVVRSLLAALDPDQRDLVEAAAVLGDEIDERLLARIRPPGESIMDTLTAAGRAGLLAPAEDGHGYRFAHALIRDGIVDRLEPMARRRLHQSVATALEPAGDDQAARIARHWRHSGPGAGTTRRAAHWSRRAAMRARADQAYEDMVRHLTDALTDLSTVDDGAADRAEVLVELATAEYLAGRYDRCLAHCVEAADRADATGRPDLLTAAALVLQAVTFPEAGGVVTGLCRRALATPGLDDGHRARLLAQLAVMTADAGRVQDAVGPAREALELARRSGDRLAEMEAARAREMTLVLPQDTADRLVLGDLVVGRAGSDQPVAAIIGHGWRIQAAYLLGRLDIVDDAAAATGQLARSSALPVARWRWHRMRASLALLHGRFAESGEQSRAANEIALVSGDPSAVGMYFAHGVFQAGVRGEPGDLPDGYQSALASAPAMPLIDASQAIALAVTGSLVAAREHYDRVTAVLPIPADHPAWAAVLIELVGLTELFADTAAAEIMYRQLLPYRDYPGALGTPTVYFTGSVSRHLGQLAALLGERDTAVALLREAVVRNRALGARPDGVLSGLALAGQLSAGGRAELAEAAQLVQGALDLAVRLEMPGPVAAAGRLSAELAALRSRADPLTAREREVARLLADALTNRQIATRLVLSERTVESHVRSILAKTGCTNRTEFTVRWTG